MKSQIETKKKVSIMELLTSTLNESCRYQFLLAYLERKNHEQP